MSGLVERVKEKVRSRSKSRKSVSLGSEREARQITEPGSGNVPDSPRRGRMQDESIPSRVTQDNPPAYANNGTGHPASDRVGNYDEAANYRNTNAVIRDSAAGYTAHPESTSRTSEAIPDRDSTRHRSHISQSSNAPISHHQETRGTTSDVSGLPPRTDSLVSRKPLPLAKEDGQLRDNDGRTGDLNQHRTRRSLDIASNSKAPNGTRTSNGNVAGLGTSRSQDVAPQDSSPLVPKFAQRSLPTTHEHLRVPGGFDLGSSERTDVATAYAPAVTHETIRHQRTEIVQEAITRDIHIHHYYTYLQPIKVVEVLPAIHWYLNEKTGEKRQIEAPAGWVMPDNLVPRKADTSVVKGYERHYLVDEQHPHGILETTPLNPKDDHSHFHHEPKVGNDHTRLRQESRLGNDNTQFGQESRIGNDQTRLNHEPRVGRAM